MAQLSLVRKKESGKPEVEPSGFFVDSVVSWDVFLEAVLQKDVFLE